MTREERSVYQSLRSVIRECAGACSEPGRGFLIQDVVQMLHENHPDLWERVKDQMAEIGLKAEIRKVIKDFSPREAQSQLLFLPEDYDREGLLPTICCPPEGADLDEDEGKFPRIELAQASHQQHARFIALLERGIERDVKRLRAHRYLHETLAPYVQGDEPYAEVCKRMPRRPIVRNYQAPYAEERDEAEELVAR